MILKCRNCGGSLEYDSVTDKMLCPYCFSTYEVTDFEGEETKESHTDWERNTADWQESEDDTMDTEIYTCTSCGAQLMINHVESATFCAYCGQPTIVFDRVSKMKRPKYIVPFTITKERAHGIIRERFAAGKYIPESVKNFKPELVRGIYVPFMLYDVDYYDRQLIRSEHKSGRSSVTYYHYREASNRFSNITVDASTNFDDESSQRLEPYDLTNMQPFQIGYLSGFYADCLDDDRQKMELTAITRGKELFDQAVLSTVSGNGKRIIDNNPSASVICAEYVMLPVWFVVFREEEKHYTIMVNGQTGKMVGAVPCDMAKIKENIGVYCSFCSVVAAALLGWLYRGAGYSDFEAVMKVSSMILVAIGALVLYIKKQYSAYRKSRKLTAASQIKHLASDRQEDTT